MNGRAASTNGRENRQSHTSPSHTKSLWQGFEFDICQAWRGLANMRPHPGTARPAPRSGPSRSTRGFVVRQINVGIVGTGWCGGIRAETAAANPLVKELHVIETRPERLAEIAEKTHAVTAGT